MLIQRIKISNFKTYLSLDLDLTVDDGPPYHTYRRVQTVAVKPRCLKP